MSEIAQAFVRIRPDTRGFKAEAEKGILGTVTSIARRTGAILAIGGGIGALKTLFVDPIKSAGDFQKSLSVLQATANATDAQMKSVSATAIQLGADVRLPATSAKDATDAMLELAKAGFSVTASQKAARGVIELSTAAQIDNATAAQIAANAINAFGLRASESTRVADLLAGAANASSASMTDVAESLQFAASVAHQAKVPIEDVVTAIAEMANRGISGSVAGSALAQTLRSLQAPTSKSKDELQKLGISVFDAQGNFRGIRPLIEQFSAATENLTQQERARAIQTIFGSRAQQAANIVLLGGVKAFDKLKGATTEQGAAQKLASAQTKGFSGAVSGLRSTVETLQIQIGLKLLPVMTSLTRSLTANLPGAVNAAVSAVETLANVVGVLADHFDVIGPLLGGAIVAFTAYKAIVITTTAVTATYAAVTAALNTAQVLLAGGTSALSIAQSIQASSMSTAAIAAAAEAATMEALTLAVAGVAIATTGAFAPTTALALASAGLAAAEDALAVSAGAAAAEMGVLDVALLANPIGLLTLAIAGGAGLIFALTRLGSGTTQLAGPFGSAADAVNNLSSALRAEKDAVNALIHDNIDLRQSHLDVTRSTAALAAANADVVARQRVVNQLQRDGEANTKAYRDAVAALTQAKQGETQASIDHDRAVANEGDTETRVTADLAKQRSATEASTASVKSLTGSFTAATAEAEHINSVLEVTGQQMHGSAISAQRAAENVADFAKKTADLSAKTTAALPSLEATAKKANEVADGFGNSRSKAALAAKSYAANADAAVAAARKLARLESTASLLAAAWGKIVDLPTAQFFIKETTQLTTIENNRLKRAGGGFIPKGVLSTVGETGAELTVGGATGTNVINHTQSVGLLQNLSSSVNALARAIADQAVKAMPTAPGVAFNAPVTIETAGPKDFIAQLAALVPR
jgi:TP901 family phage tail tape measure protein